MNLVEKIQSKQAHIGIIGLGYVGLPLGVAFAERGFQVTGIDLNKDKVDTLNHGLSYITDIENETLQTIVEKRTFRATTDFSAIRKLDAICICVPTPLNKNQEPDLSYVEAVVTELQAYLQPETLVILESTTYPGTTEERIEKVLTCSGLTAGIDYYLCYSPERVDPGNKTYTIDNTPKVIGGVTKKCQQLAETLYGTIVNDTILVSNPKVAEMSKLLENTFRSVNIAFINEMALLCDMIGVNIWEVIHAASTKPFGFIPFYPGPGIGGHCIPLDPMYLSWRAKEVNFFSRFIELSQDSNMPRFVVRKIEELLNTQKKCINGSRILLLGMAYKPDVNDLRESPSLDIYELLKEKGALMTVNDPCCNMMFDASNERVELQHTMNYSELDNYDLVVLLTAHSAYNVNQIAESGVLILDTRNAFKGVQAPNIARIGDELGEVHPEAAKEKILVSG
ncbi:nucleotide sugar dehydrogenase [Siminovitchia terrae]|uniref:nucleotide sugar dehydrogenase n=1 Tax=Siminovitchia terrae TaxID=1914933 RepID=UPI0028A95DD9|nr:nucleotide sugar dehydrogenase [Siminovitchia terrae]